MKTQKTKHCKICSKQYGPRAAFSKVCDTDGTYQCAKIYAEQQTASKQTKQATKERKETLQKLEAMRTKPQLVKLAQTAFNGWVRARDNGKGCISCGKPLQIGGVGGGFDAGHWRSIGAAVHLRFAPDNCHGQCKHCNNYLAGNAANYRSGLIKRIGLPAVEVLEADQTVRKYTKEGLIKLAEEYRALARCLKSITTGPMAPQNSLIQRD